MVRVPRAASLSRSAPPPAAARDGSQRLNQLAASIADVNNRLAARNTTATAREQRLSERINALVEDDAKISSEAARQNTRINERLGKLVEALAAVSSGLAASQAAGVKREGVLAGRLNDFAGAVSPASLAAAIGRLVPAAATLPVWLAPTVIAGVGAWPVALGLVAIRGLWRRRKGRKAVLPNQQGVVDERSKPPAAMRESTPIVETRVEYVPVEDSANERAWIEASKRVANRIPSASQILDTLHRVKRYELSGNPTAI